MCPLGGVDVSSSWPAANPNCALSPDEPRSSPPPVTKSCAGCWHGDAQVMSLSALEIITWNPLAVVKSNAFTVIPLEVGNCSFITSDPAGVLTVCPTVPSAVNDCVPIVRPAILLEPEMLVHVAMDVAIMEVAFMTADSS